jgi:hypothetical protein
MQRFAAVFVHLLAAAAPVRASNLRGVFSSRRNVERFLAFGQRGNLMADMMGTLSLESQLASTQSSSGMFNDR